MRINFKVDEDVFILGYTVYDVRSFIELHFPIVWIIKTLLDPKLSAK